ncbi:MAG: hypothetical protein K8S56_03205, partial [Candidatus Cloacimonetes bacterium]|nr:hypothetical protein [Candidatus Cloacimonadota bacterium]
MKILLSTFLISMLLLPLSAAELTIRKLRFEGNRLLPDRVLHSVVMEQSGDIFNQENANEDSRRIMEAYKRRNIYSVRVSYPEAVILNRKQTDVVFHIEEGSRFTVDLLHVNGNRYFSDAKLLSLTGLTGDTYKPDMIANAILTITDLYSSRGFLFVETTLDSIAFIEDTTHAWISVDEGELCRFANYRFRGNEVTKPSTLLKLSRLNQMEIVSRDNLLQIEENIRRREYIKECRLVPLNAGTLLFDVTEDRMTRLAALFGIDNESDQIKDSFTGYINLELMNLFGTDRALQIFWQRLESDVESIELAYHESGPLRFSFAGDFSLLREEVDSTYIHTAFDTDLYYYTLY